MLLLTASIPLFRYFSSAQYAKALVERGQLRLGSVRKYTDAELAQEDCARGDPEEGTSKIAINSYSGNSLGLAAGAQTGFHTDEFSQIKLSDCHVSTTHSDLLLLCVSDKKSFKIARHFESFFCVEIYDPQRFKKALHATMHSLGYNGSGWKRVLYVPSRTMSHEDQAADLPPWQLKRSDPYSIQREWRLAWSPIEQQPVPKFLDVCCPELAECCRLHVLQ